MIKQGTMYAGVVNFINSYKLGETFTTSEFKDALYDMTRKKNQHKKWNGQFYRILSYRTYLKSAGFITNVKRGVWRINYHVPNWMSLYALETLRGYKDGYWNGREYVKRPVTFHNELSARLKAYKQRIDKDGVDEQVSESQDTKLYAICTRTHYDGYYIKGKEYEVLSVDENGTVTKIINEEGRPWILFTDSFAGGPYRGKAADKIMPTSIGWKVGDEFYVLVRRPWHHYIITEISSSNVVTIVTSDDMKRWGNWTVEEVNELFKRGRWNHLSQEEKAPEQSKTMVCTSNGSYNRLTIGKEYKIIGEEDYHYNIIDDDGDEVSMFKWRFAEIKTPQQDTKKTWKVGDTLSEDLLNNHPHIFYGYNESWETRSTNCFKFDRKIEKIDIVEGRLAALISGTSNIWIEIATIDGPVDKVPQERLSEFLTELEALIAKYK